jgi:hypothetical protein
MLNANSLTVLGGLRFRYKQFVAAKFWKFTNYFVAVPQSATVLSGHLFWVESVSLRLCQQSQVLRIYVFHLLTGILGQRGIIECSQCVRVSRCVLILKVHQGILAIWRFMFTLKVGVFAFLKNRVDLARPSLANPTRSLLDSRLAHIKFIIAVHWSFQIVTWGMFPLILIIDNRVIFSFKTKL